jgi:hypothetical protein
LDVAAGTRAEALAGMELGRVDDIGEIEELGEEDKRDLPSTVESWRVVPVRDGSF